MDFRTMSGNLFSLLCLFFVNYPFHFSNPCCIMSKIVYETYQEERFYMFKSGKKLSLTVQIFVSLVLGVIAGLLLQDHAAFANTYIKPFGTVYLNLIKMIVVPVVLLSIIQGIVSLQDIRKVGTIGGRTVLYFLCTTAIAVDTIIYNETVLNDILCCTFFCLTTNYPVAIICPLCIRERAVIIGVIR